MIKNKYTLCEFRFTDLFIICESEFQKIKSNHTAPRIVLKLNCKCYYYFIYVAWRMVLCMYTQIKPKTRRKLQIFITGWLRNYLYNYLAVFFINYKGHHRVSFRRTFSPIKLIINKLSIKIEILRIEKLYSVHRFH